VLACVAEPLVPERRDLDLGVLGRARVLDDTPPAGAGCGVAATVVAELPEGIAFKVSTC